MNAREIGEVFVCRFMFTLWVRKDVEVCTVFKDRGSFDESCVLDVNRNFLHILSEMRFTLEPVSSKKRKTFLVGKASTKTVGRM